jgi:hypothetical protein
MLRYAIIGLIIFTLEWIPKGKNYMDVLIRFLNSFTIADLPLTYLIWGDWAMQFQSLVFQDATKKKYFFILGLMYFSWTSYSYGVLYSVAYLLKDVPLTWKNYLWSGALIGLGAVVTAVPFISTALNLGLGFFQLYPTVFKGSDVIAACLIGFGFELLPLALEHSFLNYLFMVLLDV